MANKQGNKHTALATAFQGAHRRSQSRKRDGQSQSEHAAHSNQSSELA